MLPDMEFSAGVDSVSAIGNSGNDAEPWTVGVGGRVARDDGASGLCMVVPEDTEDGYVELGGLIAATGMAMSGTLTMCT